MAAPVPSNRRGVTVPAVLVGILCCLVIAAGEPFGVLVVLGSPLAADFSTGYALVLMLVLVLVGNPLVGALTGRRLQRGELITVHIMMIVAAAIPSWGFMMNLIPIIGGFFYFATPENQWASLILPYLPESMLPARHEVVWELFEGAAQGQPVPWGTWLQPLVLWFLFICNIYFVMLCLLVILRRQWVERERLLFPLAVLPLEMTDDSDGRRLPPILRNPLTWIGFLVPMTINTINGLHSYYNFIPRINLEGVLFFLRNSFRFSISPKFEVIGLSYLLSLDVSFGIWFFAFLFHIQTAVERVLGWTIGPQQPFSDPAPPTVAHLGMGALLVLVISGFYYGRAHIRDVFRKAFRKDPEVDDSDEIMSYRVAVFGLLGGLLFATAWLVHSGLSLLSTVIFLASSIVIFVGLARIISQTGLAYARATVPPPVFTVNALGTGLIGPEGLAVLGLHFAWCADVRTFVMASAATGMKLAEVTRLQARRLLWAIAIAIVVTLGGSAWAVIELGYTYGGINLGYWHFTGMPIYAGNWIASNINNPQPIQTWHLAYTGAGALIMAVLSYVKARFVGFPVHPVGMALGLTWPIYRVWFSVFIAWMIKAVILRYGGPTLYLRLRPFFLGLILGAFSSGGLWLVIDAITGMTGNRFTVG